MAVPYKHDLRPSNADCYAIYYLYQNARFLSNTVKLQQKKNTRQELLRCSGPLFYIFVAMVTSRASQSHVPAAENNILSLARDIWLHRSAASVSCIAAVSDHAVQRETKLMSPCLEYKTGRTLQTCQVLACVSSVYDFYVLLGSIDSVVRGPIPTALGGRFQLNTYASFTLGNSK